MRRIVYITGTRADYGLMQSTLQRIAQSSQLELSLAVTGMHLDPGYGETVHEIEASGLNIAARIPVRLHSDNGGVMARAIAHELLGMVDTLERERPDMVLLLGDRGEMLAGALAAIHLNIPVVHIHGGELSGTVDEPVRHAISKLSHYHFTATEGARERLIKMGELPEHIFVTGAPGLDGLADFPKGERNEMCRQYGFDPEQPVALVVFHPVVQNASEAGLQADALMQAILEDAGYQALVLLPNADAGGEQIRAMLERYASPRFRTVVHLPREEYLSWLTVADVMVGNSSSGIIEAASFGIAVVNVGERQNRRERNANVVDVSATREVVAEGLKKASKLQGPYQNIYGDGHAGERIVGLLESLPVSKELLQKCNAY